MQKSKIYGECRLMISGYKDCIQKNHKWYSKYKEKAYKILSAEEETARNLERSTKRLLTLVKNEKPYIEKIANGYSLCFSTGIMFCKGAVADAVLPPYVAVKEGFFY